MSATAFPSARQVLNSLRKTQSAHAMTELPSPATTSARRRKTSTACIVSYLALGALLICALHLLAIGNLQPFGTSSSSDHNINGDLTRPAIEPVLRASRSTEVDSIPVSGKMRSGRLFKDAKWTRTDLPVGLPVIASASTTDENNINDSLQKADTTADDGPVQVVVDLQHEHDDEPTDADEHEDFVVVELSEEQKQEFERRRQLHEEKTHAHNYFERQMRLIGGHVDSDLGTSPAVHVNVNDFFDWADNHVESEL